MRKYTVLLAVTNNGQIYIGIGNLIGWPVKVLRDTGWTGMIVDMALIPNSMVIPGIATDCRSHSDCVPLASVYLDSLYSKKDIAK